MVPLRYFSSTSARVLALLTLVNGCVFAAASCGTGSTEPNPSGLSSSGTAAGGEGGTGAQGGSSGKGGAGGAGGAGGQGAQGGSGAQGGAGGMTGASSSTGSGMGGMMGSSTGSTGSGMGGMMGSSTGSTGSGSGGTTGASTTSSTGSGMGGMMGSSSSAGTGAGGAMDMDAGELPDVLPDFTDAEQTPVIGQDGCPSPLPGVYTDLGPADPASTFRSLIAIPMRDKAILEDNVRHIYTPGDPQFRKYMTPDQWMTAHGPSLPDLNLVKIWLESQGFLVPYVATNRMLIEFQGTVDQFNTVFQTTMHLFSRENPQVGNPPIDVLGTLEPIKLPLWVTQRIAGIVTCDVGAEQGMLSIEAGGVVVQTPAANTNYATPTKIAKAYGLQKATAAAPNSLYEMGFKGQGVKLGVTIGAMFRYKDLQSFWQSFGVVRDDPVVVQTMEPAVTRYVESTLDVEWSGVMAPMADMIVYSGPDSRNTAMVYTFNEAIARNEVSIITDSFAHREDSEPALVRTQYGDSALQAAAYGITVIAATGDSGQIDTPSNSPYVTGAGGTRLQWGAGDVFLGEVAWNGGGCGDSLTFLMPDWQLPFVTNVEIAGRRATADVALNSSPSSPYWVYYLNGWKLYGGTSFASPVFAGVMAVVDSYLKANNKPNAGWLNSVMYSTPAVRSTFRDITSGGVAPKAAKVGWDYVTGLGAPSGLGLATTLP